MEKKAQLNLPVVILSILFVIVLVSLIFIISPYVQKKNVSSKDTPANLENMTRLETIEDAAQHSIEVTEEIVSPSCADECSARGLKKGSERGYQVCGDYDSDICYEWSEVKRCDLGYEYHSGRCAVINSSENISGQNGDPVITGPIKYDFDEIELLSTEKFSIKKDLSANSFTWADSLSGESNVLEVIHSVFNLKKEGQILVYEEEFIKISGINGDQRYLKNSGGGFTDLENAGKISKRQFWSAKQLVGDDMIKDKTLPVYSVILEEEYDSEGVLQNAKLSFSDTGLSDIVNFGIETGKYDWKKVEVTPEKNGTDIEAPKNPFNLTSEFKPSEVLVDISEETGKPDQYYCSYDENRNKVTVIIKGNGIYDNEQIITAVDQYFISVKNDINIDSIGIKKFSGSSIAELDEFIEKIVEEENVGYIILVGTDLPDTVVEENRMYLDHGTINDIYAYIGREKTGCVDVAISSVFAPEGFSNEKKISFVQETFQNFVDYHSAPQEYYQKYSGIVSIEWDNNLDSNNFGASVGGMNNPEGIPDYRRIYFYPVEYILNTDFKGINNAMGNKHLLLNYNVHGWAESLGIGLNSNYSVPLTADNVYDTPEEILQFNEQMGQSFLFVKIFGACGQNFLSSPDQTFCCWPQVWLKTGVWTVTDVSGDPYHHNFQRWSYNEKVIGKALRKTYHSQDMIYGDVLGVMP